MSDGTPSYPQLLYQPDDGASQILLVRHGQSAPYVSGRPFDLIDGHGDPHLTDLGHHQARLVARRLRDEPIAAVYASNLTRTQQTAAPLAEELGIDIEIDADLREVFLGDGEGGLLREMGATGHPAAVALRANREWGEIPGAETNAQLQARTVGAIERIVGRHANELVAVFCHGGVIGAILGHAAGVNPFTFNGSRHTGISHLVVNPTGWVIRSFNDGGHSGRLTVDFTIDGDTAAPTPTADPATP